VDDYRDLDLERLSEINEERLDRIRGLEPVLRDLTGSAESANGLVRSTVDSSNTLSELFIDPRAMRLGSEALAEQIVEATAGASRQLQEQVESLMRDAMGQDAPLSVSEVQRAAESQFAEIESGLRRTLDQIMGDVDKLRRNMQPGQGGHA
jgi:DNA-binding protein YbaB